MSRLLVYSLATGFLLACSWPVNGFTPLIFISLIPILYVEDLISKDSLGKKNLRLFFYSYIAFLAWNISTTWWIVNSTLPGAIFANLVNSSFYSIILLLYSRVKRKIDFKAGALFFITFWIAFEKFHLNWEFSWPWLNLGNVFSERINWIQWYDNMMDKYSNLTWIKNIYWRLEQYSCILVLRNKEWFQHAIIQIEKVWNIIEQEKIKGYEHRMPKKMKNRSRTNSIQDTEPELTTNSINNSSININTNMIINESTNGPTTSVLSSSETTLSGITLSEMTSIGTTLNWTSSESTLCSNELKPQEPKPSGCMINIDNLQEPKPSGCMINIDNLQESKPSGCMINIDNLQDQIIYIDTGFESSTSELNNNSIETHIDYDLSVNIIGTS